MSERQLSVAENKAWELYCAETAGGMDVRDSWEDLNKPTQAIFLKKVIEGKDMKAILADAKRNATAAAMELAAQYYVETGLIITSLDIDWTQNMGGEFHVVGARCSANV